MESSSSSEKGLQTRVRQQEVVAALGQQALESDDLDQLLHDAAVAVAETLDTKYAEVLKLFPGGDELLLRQGVGWRDGLVGEATVSADLDSQTEYTLATEEPVIVQDLQTEERFLGADLLASHDIVSGIRVVIGSVNDPWGMLGVHTTEHREFTQHDADFVQSVANVLTSAIESQQTKHEFEEIYGRISDAFFALDENWEFTYLNERAHELINPEGRKLLGKNVWEEFPDATSRKFKPKYERAMYEQKTVSFEEYYPEPLDRWFEVRAYPSKTGLSSYFQDITERKEREEKLADTISELRESKERLHLALKAGEMGTWELDLQTEDSQIRSPQHDRIFGYEEPLEDWDFETFLDHVHPDDREKVRQCFERAFETGTWDFECRITRADGEERTISAQGKFYFDDEGEPDRAVGVVQDVTEQKRYEQALAESEQRYRTLAENFPNGGVGIFDEDLRYTLVTGTMWDDIEPDATDLEGETIHEALPPETAADVEPIFQGALAGESGSVVSHLGGRTYRVWVTPLRGADGDIIGGQSFALDITDQHKRERELKESERRYRTLAEHFPNGIVTLFDDDLRYTLAAGQAFDDLPVTQEDVESRRPREVWGDDVGETLEPALKAALNGQTRSVEVEYESREWAVHAVPVTDDEGEVFAGMTMAQDITEQKERKRELERALDLLDKTERIADVGGWEIDVDTMDVFWTDHIFELLEVSTDEEPPLDEALEMYHEEDRTIVQGAIEEALETGDPFDVEARIHTQSGAVRGLRLQGVPETVDGDVVTLRGAAQDITERKEREQALEESNERLEQFAYAASHDLQEPLRMVTSYLQLVEDRYADELDEDGEEFIEFAVDGAERMREMIEGLLEYSRVDTRGDPFEAVDLDAVFADVRQDLEVKIEESDAEITAEDLPEVYGDGGQLNQVFQNLISNAIEYSGEEPPRVHVSAERAAGGEEWVISVRDEGIGIDPDDADRIFEVFQRLHTHRVGAGAGIGLALCERIVERHGGDIWVDSEPGEGATFHFTLPAAGDGDE